MRLFEVVNQKQDTEVAVKFFNSPAWGDFVTHLVKTKDPALREMGTMLANDVKRGNYQQFVDTINMAVKAAQQKKSVPGLPKLTWEGGAWEYLLKAAATLKQLVGVSR